MLLTVLLGELLVILILLALLQIIKLKWLHIVLYLILLISFAATTYYVVNPVGIQITSNFPFVQKIDTVRADYNDKKTQLTTQEFSESEKDYDYVSYTELSQNNSLYRGKTINQWGKVKKVIASNKLGRRIVLDLNESHSADLVLVDYHLSDLAKGITNVKVNDQIKVYGESAISEKHGMPVINAHFIRYE